MGSFLNYLNRLFGVGQVEKESERISVLEAGLQGLVTRDKVPGMAITILRDGETLYQQGFGYANIQLRTPVDPRNTLFRIASASKPIAALALATLVAEGKINLDESLYTYVPYFPGKEYDFTIRQLASHTAGIRGYRGKEYAQNKPLSIREGIEIFQNDPLVFQPGTGYLYNSFDWVLVSLAMEEVSGMSFDRYVQQHVLSPLGMKNTTMEDPADLPEESAEFYTRVGSGFRPAIPVDNRYKLAGGGYLSTSEDLAILGRSCLDNTLVPQRIMKEFLTPQYVKGRSTYYGLGWQVTQDLEGRPFYGHVGNGIGGYSNFFIYPEQQVVVAVLVNCTDPGIQSIIDTEILPFLFRSYTV